MSHTLAALPWPLYPPSPHAGVCPQSRGSEVCSWTTVTERCDCLFALTMAVNLHPQL